MSTWKMRDLRDAIRSLQYIPITFVA